MARANNTRRPLKDKKKSKEPTRSRRREILGVILMSVAVLLSMAILTYHPGDDELLPQSDIRIGQLLVPNFVEGTGNALGTVGAVLAHYLVPNFLGYTTLLFTALLFVWGYMIMRQKSLRAMPRISLVTILVAMLIAPTLTRIDYAVGNDLSFVKGSVGIIIVDWLMDVFSAKGSFVVLGVIIVILLLAITTYDIQRPLDFLEKTVLKILALPGKGWTRWKQFRQLRGEEIKEERKAEEMSWTDIHAKKEEEKVQDNTEEDQDSHIKEVSTPVAAAPPPPSQPQQLELRIISPVTEEKIDHSTRTEENESYTFPSLDLLDAPDNNTQHLNYDELEEKKSILLNKLADYKIEIIDINAIVGPTVTLYELTPAPGIKISRIKSLEDDLAMVMAARGIRIIAPIPGKSVVGVEIPNKNRELVRLHSIIGTKSFRNADMQLPVALGKTIEGEVFLRDLAKMPHLLIAGATGSGKSVGLNTLIAGLLYACPPSKLKFVMVDPKKIELQQYKDLHNHYLAIPEEGENAIITDVAEALGVLKACEREMENRYTLLSDTRVRGIQEYNELFQKGNLDEEQGHRHLPYIVVIIDELADLMMTAGKDIEAPIARLAQMARAIGIHLVLATQRPSVDVITGLIKANFPSRIAFQVASKIDARTILDQNGAEGLVGNGDMLYMSGSRLLRLQGPFVSSGEIDRLMDFICEQSGPGPYMLPPIEEDLTLTQDSSTNSNSTDELFEEAAHIIVRSQQGSVSLLQRKLSIGYTRAARLVDQLEQAGIVGKFMGSKAREVLVEDEMKLKPLLEDLTTNS